MDKNLYIQKRMQTYTTAIKIQFSIHKTEKAWVYEKT